jgi:cation-transporting P-type ATPase C
MRNIKIIHAIPGRLRIQLNGEQLTKDNAVSVETIVRSISGIYSVNVNPISNRMLIYYDVTELNESETLAAIREKLFSHPMMKKFKTGAMVSTTLGLAITFEVLKSKNRYPFIRKVLLASSLLTNLIFDPAVVKSGIDGIKKLSPNAESLTLISILAAYTIQQPLAATTVILMSRFSDYLGELTSEQSRENLTHSIRHHERYVWQVNDAGEEVKTPVSEIKVGDKLRIFTGEKIAVDGIVISGDAYVDESKITGEFTLKHKLEGNEIFASTVVQSGQIEILATSVGKNTQEAAIYRLINEAEGNVGELQKIADKIADKMVKISLGAASLAYIVHRNITKAVGILVIDFVCGIRLSSEIAVLTAMNHFTKHGVIIKGGRAIENTANIKRVLFDKTGTLTTGMPEIKAIYLTDSKTEEELLARAAYAEQHSMHPLGNCIVKVAEEKKIQLPKLKISDETVVSGKGIEAKNFGDETILVGSQNYLLEENVSGFELLDLPTDIDGTLTFVASNQQLIGALVIDDAVRPRMKQTIATLKENGIDEVWMLTGDKKAVAEKVGKQLGIDHIASELLPKDKVELVQNFEKETPVMMVGDGLNDSAALKWASVGVTLGDSATDLAKQMSDIIIAHDEPEKIAEIYDISKRTMTNISQNFKAVFSINSIAMLLSYLGKIKPITSAFIHNGTTIAVILHAILALR